MEQEFKINKIDKSKNKMKCFLFSIRSSFFYSKINILFYMHYPLFLSIRHFLKIESSFLIQALQIIHEKSFFHHRFRLSQNNLLLCRETIHTRNRSAIFDRNT